MENGPKSNIWIVRVLGGVAVAFLMRDLRKHIARSKTPTTEHDLRGRSQ